MDLQSYPRRIEQVISQKSSSDFLLFNMQDGNYYALNEIGHRIWELCDGDHSVAQLADTLASEFDAPVEIITNDVMELLEELRTGELIVETGRNDTAVR